MAWSLNDGDLDLDDESDLDDKEDYSGHDLDEILRRMEERIEVNYKKKKEKREDKVNHLNKDNLQKGKT